jgi:hypothetical protein
VFHAVIYGDWADADTLKILWRSLILMVDISNINTHNILFDFYLNTLDSTAVEVQFNQTENRT